MTVPDDEVRSPCRGVVPTVVRTPAPTDVEPDAAASSDPELEALVRVAAAIAGTPMATINLLDEHAQFQLATLGFPQLVTPRDESLCDRALCVGGVFASADLRADEQFADSPWVDGRRDRIRGYAMVPLPLDGSVVGTLCVQSRDVHPLDADQLDRLRDLGQIVVALLARRRQSRENAELARAAEAAREELAVAHDELRLARAFDEALLDALPVGVIAADADGRVKLFNRVNREWHGRNASPDSPRGSVPARMGLWSADGSRQLSTSEVPLLKLMRDGELTGYEMRIVAPGQPPRLVSCSGETVRDPDGRLLGGVVTLADITAHRELEQQLRAAALHDPLTGLPNRSLLVDRLALALAAALRSDAHLAVLYCDLDGFKAVNDRWGHAAGDAVLTQTAARLTAAVRPGDTVARIGGDEFVLLCPDVDGLPAAEQLAARVTAALVQPLRTGPGTVHSVGASIGVALSAPGATPETLLTAADEAMYRVKSAGRART